MSVRFLMISVFVIAITTTLSFSSKFATPLIHDRMESIQAINMQQKLSHHRILMSDRYRKRQSNSPPRGEQASSYSRYVGYHARDRNGQSEEFKTFYGYPEDEEQPPKSWFELRYEATTLWDVWMCWALAVGWTTWMFGSFVKSELLRYGQDSIMVRGNVRMVTLDEASMGTGIPIYKAVIDYIIPAQLCAGGGRFRSNSPYTHPPYPYVANTNPPSHVAASTFGTYSEDENNSTPGPTLQIRKEFETLHPLEQGFGNVELLVLHHEPTTSIIKEDWEQQVMEEMEESRSRRAYKQNCCSCLTRLCRCIDGICCGFGKDAYGENLIGKRIWIVFCLVMILLAMTGSVLAVDRLPFERRRLGWLCLCLESLLLIPLALAIRLAITSVQRSFIPQGRAGIVLGNSPSFSSTPTIKNHHPPQSQQYPGLAWGDSGTGENTCCMDPSDVLDVQICEEDEVESLQHTREHHQHQHVGDQEYVLRLPGMQRESSDVSDMSNDNNNGDDGQSMHLNTMSTHDEDDTVDSDDSVGKQRKAPSMVEDGVMA